MKCAPLARARMFLAAFALTGAVASASAATLDLGSASATSTYHSTLTPGSGVTCDIDNCVRVQITDRHGGGGGVFILEGNGGWASGLPTLGADPSIIIRGPDVTELRFTVSTDYNDWFAGALTGDQQREFAVTASVTVTPTHEVPGNLNARQVESFTFGGGQDGSHTFSFLPQWVDSQVRISLVMTPDPAHLLNSPPEWRFETPALRLRFLPDTFLELPVLPLGIIGKPPGLNSWSSIAQTEGSVVKTGIREETAQAETHSHSVGIGPIPIDSSDEVTRERRAGEGTYQLFGWENKGAISSAGPLRNGEADLLVLAQGVDVLVYHAALDADFLLSEIDGIAYFPMRELLVQRNYLTGQATTQSSNSVVRGLALPVIRALIALNPVLENPYARLAPPRFHKVGVRYDGQGGALTQRYEVQGAEIQTALQASSTTTVDDSTFDVELPINAIIKAISGYDVPAELVNPQFTNVQVGTSIVELVSSAEITRHTGEVIEYGLFDTTGAEFCSEAFFDSLFNALLFRDCTLPCDRPGAICLSSLVARPDSWRFGTVEAVRGGFLTGRSDYYVVGSLRLDGADRLRTIRFARTDRPGPSYESSLDPATGAFVLPNLRPGMYRAKVGSDVHELTLSKAGDLRYQRRGRDARSPAEQAFAAADGTDSTRTFRDACTVEERTRRCTARGERCTSTHRRRDLCGDRRVFEETCTTERGRTVCR